MNPEFLQLRNRISLGMRPDKVTLLHNIAQRNKRRIINRSKELKLFKTRVSNFQRQREDVFQICLVLFLPSFGNPFDLSIAVYFGIAVTREFIEAVAHCVV